MLPKSFAAANVSETSYENRANGRLALGQAPHLSNVDPGLSSNNFATMGTKPTKARAPATLKSTWAFAICRPTLSLPKANHWPAAASWLAKTSQC
jgi:hypothetical protein